MVFEAHYSKWRLSVLALLGLGFVALGLWMAFLPASEFDGGSGRRIAGLAATFGVAPVTMGHGIGWACAIMGLLVLPIVAGNLLHKGPAMRIDERGIFWHRWSADPIPWSNIAQISPYSVSGQKMVGIGLADRSLSPPRGRFGKLGSVNKAMGYGDLSLTLNGTDGKYEELLETLVHFESRT